MKKDKGTPIRETTIDEASRILCGMIMYDFHVLYGGKGGEKVVGKSMMLRTNVKEDESKFRTLALYDNGKVFISDWY
ncbi:MAG: hypothetical protein PHG19_04140 [Anaerotignum sp.]|nr:hypothetical protein [Anaerotignum sp.]